jgi:hypothetical protein
MNELMTLRFGITIFIWILLQFDSYGSIKSKAKKINSTPKYEVNLLDSSIFYLQDRNNLTLTPQRKQIFTYDTNHLNTSTVTFQFNTLTNTWWNYEIDSFFYNTNGRFDYYLRYYWDITKLKYMKSNFETVTYDLNDSIIKYESLAFDTLGNIIPCSGGSIGTKFYPTVLSKCNVDSSFYGCSVSYLNDRDSIVFNSNGTLKEKFYSTDYYGFYGLGFQNGYWDSYYYNQNNELEYILNKSINSMSTVWDTTVRKVYINSSIGRTNYYEYWNNSQMVWVSYNTDSIFEYKPIYDQFNNVIIKRNMEWNQRLFYSFDSTHYYYHIPSCLSYYTTDYDTLTNSFNLTLDSITNTQAVAYHWDFGDGSSSNLQFPSHTYLIDTTYNVCLTIYKLNGDSCTYCHIIGKDYQGHIIKSAGFNLNVKGQGNIGVNEIMNGKAELMVYPNPCGEKLLVTSYQLLVNTIEVTDVLGRILLVRQAHYDVGSHAEERSISIDVTNYPSGLYFLKATDEKGNSYNAKFVKQ